MYQKFKYSIFEYFWHLHRKWFGIRRRRSWLGLAVDTAREWPTFIVEVHCTFGRPYTVQFSLTLVCISQQLFMYYKKGEGREIHARISNYKNRLIKPIFKSSAKNNSKFWNRTKIWISTNFFLLRRFFSHTFKDCLIVNDSSSLVCYVRSDLRWYKMRLSLYRNRKDRVLEVNAEKRDRISQSDFVVAPEQHLSNIWHKALRHPSNLRENESSKKSVR